VRRPILQLSEAGEDEAERAPDVLPGVWCADADVIPRVRTRLGVCTAQDACKYASVQIDEVVQTHLSQQGESNGDHMKKRKKKKKDAHHVENIFTFADIDDFLERERELRHELEEDRARRDGSRWRPDDRGG
jgi:hypothetical protein